MKKGEKLSEAELFLWHYIQKHLNHIPTMSIVQLSEKANVSTATIVRTLKKQGYDGYTSFRHTLKNDPLFSKRFSHLEKSEQLIQEAIFKNQQEVLNTLQNIDVALLEDAIQKIRASSRIVIFARGLSEMTAQEMCLKFHVLNKYCEVYTDPNIIKTRSKTLSQSDTVLFISLSGETEELVVACLNCQKQDISTIVFSTNGMSRLAKMADISFVGYKTADSHFPEYEIKSRIPLNIMTRILLDAYAISLNKKRQPPTHL